MRAVILFISIVALCACQRQAPEPISNETAMVSFSVECPTMETLTRALSTSGESAVQDLNIYLFHKSIDAVKHLYITSATNIFSINLVKGEYDMFVVANYGSDMGVMTIDGVRGYECAISTEAQIESRGALLMTAHQSVLINGPTSIDVTLNRKIAKVEFNLLVAPHFAPNFTLSSVQVRNAPSRVALFSTSAATSVFDYASSGDVSQFYILENAQGVNRSITDQRQKNRSNAPVRATYIHIQGFAEGKKVEYCIYLGENNTSDFNVYGNKHYIINAVISGVNDIDSRVSTSELTTSNFAAEYKPGETAQGSLLLTSRNNVDNSFTLSYRILEGAGSVLINGASYPQNSPFPFLNTGEQSKSAAVAYTQSGSSPVRIAFTATDRYGFTLSQEMWTTYSQLRNIDITINWENLPDHTVKIWGEASDIVSSDIDVLCEFNVFWVYADGSRRRGGEVSGISKIKSGTNTGLPTIVTVPSDANPLFVGIYMDWVSNVTLSKLVDTDGTTYNPIIPKKPWEK